MIAVRDRGTPARSPILRNGDVLSVEEFCSRWDSTPNLKYAELVGNRVHVFPRGKVAHGEAHVMTLVWMVEYATATRGLRPCSKCTLYLSDCDLPLADANLCISEEFGGASRIVDGNLCGPPELVVEISYRTRVRDLRIKKPVYARSGVQEYLVWLVSEKRFVWFSLESGRYVELEHARSGVIKSRVFPGLWLDTKAMLADNWPKIQATIRQGMATEEYRKFTLKLKSQRHKRRES